MEKRKFINLYGVFCGLFTFVCQNEILYILSVFLIIEAIDMIFEKKLHKQQVLKKHFLNICVLFISISLIRFVLSLKKDLDFLSSISDTLVWTILASFGIRDIEEIFIDISKLGGYVPQFIIDELNKIDKDINKN